MAVLGCYILPPTVFDLIENVEFGIGVEIQLTDAFDKLISYEGSNMLETDASVFDCGNKQVFLNTNLAMAMLDPTVL